LPLHPWCLQVFSPDGKSLLVNQTYINLFGHEPIHNYNILKDEHGLLISHKEKITDAFKGHSIKLPITWVDSETKKLAIETSIFPIFDTADIVRFIIFVFRDATKELEHQEQLTEYQFFLEEAQKAGQIGSWVSGPNNSDSLKWSKQIYSMFGVDEKKPLRVSDFFSYVHPEDREKVHRASQEAIQNNKPFIADHRIIQPSGDVKWLRLRAEVIKDQSSKPLRMIGITQDVTELKLNEQTLRRIEERFLKLFNSLAMSISIANVEGKILEANDTFLKPAAFPPTKKNTSAKTVVEYQ